MTKISKRSATLLILLICACAVVGMKLLFQVLKPDTDAGAAARAKGNPEAAVRIIEYIDFQCKACARGARHLNLFMNDHLGEVYLELRYFPSPKQERSMLAARFAECSARQGKFWQFHDVLIPRQYRWRTLADPRPVLTQFAMEAGLDLPGLELCLKDKSVTELILEERNDGKALGVRRTPTYFINDKMLVGLKALRQELEQYPGESDH